VGHWEKERAEMSGSSNLDEEDLEQLLEPDGDFDWTVAFSKRRALVRALLLPRASKVSQLEQKRRVRRLLLSLEVVQKAMDELAEAGSSPARRRTKRKAAVRALRLLGDALQQLGMRPKVGFVARQLAASIRASSSTAHNAVPATRRPAPKAYCARCGSELKCDWSLDYSPEERLVVQTYCKCARRRDPDLTEVVEHRLAYQAAMRKKKFNTVKGEGTGGGKGKAELTRVR
jgi:hypothetical protein